MIVDSHNMYVISVYQH